jgi:hypothetical protein
MALFGIEITDRARINQAYADQVHREQLALGI